MNNHKKKPIRGEMGFLIVYKKLIFKGIKIAVIHQLKCLCDKPFKMSCF